MSLLFFLYNRIPVPLSDDEKVWEPWIIDSHGDVHPPLIIILKAFDETLDSICSATIWEIEAEQYGWIHGREQG